MSPPRIPPCSSCETMQRIGSDAAALADLDQIAAQPRASSSSPSAASPPPSGTAPSPQASRAAAGTAAPRAESPSVRGETSRPTAGSTDSSVRATSHADSSFTVARATPNLPRSEGVRSALWTSGNSAKPPPDASTRASVAFARNESPSNEPRAAANFVPRSSPPSVTGEKAAGTAFASLGLAQSMNGGSLPAVRQGAAGLLLSPAIASSVASSRSPAGLIGNPAGSGEARLSGLVTAFSSVIPASGSSALKGLFHFLSATSLGQSLPWLPGNSPANLRRQGSLGIEQTNVLRQWVGMQSLALAQPALLRNLGSLSLMRQVERSLLDFTRMFRGEYLAKLKPSEKEESAWLDKLGLFMKRRILTREDLKKLLRDRKKTRVASKRDAEWEQRQDPLFQEG